MSKQFDAYEGFKMALITCHRTLSKVDGMEIVSKLLWSLLSLYQSVMYAMLYDKEQWVVEENEYHNYDLIDAIKKSYEKGTKDAPFIVNYVGGYDEFKILNDFQLIRHNVIHANTKQLETWSADIAYLIKIFRVGMHVLNEITQLNEKSADDTSKKMRQFCQNVTGQINDTLKIIPKS